jgi:hypothetical protein
MPGNISMLLNGSNIMHPDAQRVLDCAYHVIMGVGLLPTSDEQLPVAENSPYKPRPYDNGVTWSRPIWNNPARTLNQMNTSSMATR